MARIPIDVPDSLKLEFQMKVIREHTSMTQVLTNYIKHYLTLTEKNNGEKVA